MKCAGDPYGSNRLRLLTADGDGTAAVGKYDLAPGRFLNTGNTIKERRLPGAVGPDKAEYFTLFNIKGDILKGFQPAKALKQLFDFQDWSHFFMPTVVALTFFLLTRPAFI